MTRSHTVAGSHRCFFSSAGLLCASVCASSRAKAGNIGKIYEGSLEFDRLKNTKTKTAQISRKRSAWNVELARRGQASRTRRGSSEVQGRKPASNTGAKYQNASVRCA